MRFIDKLKMLERLDRLIRMKATGSAEDLASRLGVSERTVYYLISILEELGANVMFCRSRTTFLYVDEPQIDLKTDRYYGGTSYSFLTEFALRI